MIPYALFAIVFALAGIAAELHLIYLVLSR